MSDYYREQADRLLDWDIHDIKRQPELTMGMMRSAAAAIERLVTEVERLNHENFWLSKNQKEDPTKQMVELPPLKNGDRAWGISCKGGNRYARSGPVTALEIVDGRVVISVNSVCKGHYGVNVFSTRKETMAALERIQEGVKNEN